MEDYLEDLCDGGYIVYSPEDIELSSIKECEEIINSDEFEEYVTTLAQRNPYAVRAGIPLKEGRFIMDLLRCTVAARDTFASMLSSEGTTFEEYKEQHYSECMICRDECYRKIKMPDEITAVPRSEIKAIIGNMTEKQEQRYENMTSELDDDEIKMFIGRYREFRELIGWKYIMRLDAEYEEKQ